MKTIYDYIREFNKTIYTCEYNTNDTILNYIEKDKEDESVVFFYGSAKYIEMSNKALEIYKNNTI